MKRLVAAAALVLAAACAETVRDGPPDLRLGVDLCDGCGMAISDARYAAAVLEEREGGRRILRFDDLGCVARWEVSASTPPMERWVHDRASASWLSASDAVFVRSSDWQTPMGSGLAAFRGAPPSGAVPLSWEDVVAMARREAR